MGMTYVNIYIKIVGKIIPRGIIRYAPAFFILGTQFMFGFIDVNCNIGNSGSVNDVRIVFL